jgi:hypothetical protein
VGGEEIVTGRTIHRVILIVHSQWPVTSLTSPQGVSWSLLNGPFVSIIAPWGEVTDIMSLWMDFMSKRLHWRLQQCIVLSRASGDVARSHYAMMSPYTSLSYVTFFPVVVSLFFKFLWSSKLKAIWRIKTNLKMNVASHSILRHRCACACALADDQLLLWDMPVPH